MKPQMSEAEERQTLTRRLHDLGSALTDADCAEIDLLNLRLVVNAVQSQHDLYDALGLKDAAAA